MGFVARGHHGGAAVVIAGLVTYGLLGRFSYVWIAVALVLISGACGSS